MASITDDALDITAACVGGSQVQPSHIAVGQDNTAFSPTQTTLFDETDRNQIDTRNFSINGQVTLIANWSPTDISGTIMREVGVFNSGAGGLMYSRNVLTGSLVFDGEQELQVQQTYGYYY